MSQTAEGKAALLAGQTAFICRTKELAAAADASGEPLLFYAAYVAAVFGHISAALGGVATLAGANRECAERTRVLIASAALVERLGQECSELERESVQLAQRLAETEACYGSALDDGLRKSTLYNEVVERAEAAEARLAEAHEFADAAQVARQELLARVSALEKANAELIERCASCFNEVPNVNFIRERIRALKESTAER